MHIIRFRTSGFTTVSLLKSARYQYTNVTLLVDGINGRIPNSDLVTAAVHISRWVGGVPVRLHNLTYLEPYSEEHTSMSRYLQRAKGLLEQASYGASTLPSGPEGLFGQ